MKSEALSRIKGVGLAIFMSVLAFVLNLHVRTDYEVLDLFTNQTITASSISKTEAPSKEKRND